MKIDEKKNDICHIRSENTGKFLLCNVAALTNNIYCNSQHGAKDFVTLGANLGSLMEL